MKPVVGIIMGSNSDMPIMKEAAHILDEFLVPYEMRTLSAHRTPGATHAYARAATKRGLSVIIAGAGGAAHLPGMTAAITPLTVIGVPIKTATLSGIDSLYSIVQMPKGVPVATVAIGNAANAALLAIKILAVHDPFLMKKMIKYTDNLKNKVEEKANKLENVKH